jgi:hypothetical protein
MRNQVILFSVLIISTVLLFCTCESEKYDSIVENHDFIENIKTDYQIQFKDLIYYKKLVETPLWDKYETRKDSITTYVYVPYKSVAEHIDVHLLVAISESKRNYYIKIRNTSLAILRNENEQKLTTVYVAKANNNILFSGYIDNSNYFVKTEEIPLTPQTETPSLRKGGYGSGYCEEELICICECDLGYECICDMIYGGCIPEVVVTPPSGGGGGGNSDWPNLWPYPDDPWPNIPPSSDDDLPGGGSTTPPEEESILVTLSVNPQLQTLMDNYSIFVDISSETSISSVKFEIGRQGSFNDQKWVLHQGQDFTYNGNSLKPGKWDLKASVTLSNGKIIYSDLESIEIQYPDINTVKSNSIVQSNMNSIWQATKNAASPSGRSERGFWIYANTSVMSYECGATITGPNTVGCVNTSASLNPGIYSEMPSSSPVTGGKYAVAFFHTHTPLTYCTEGVRPVGPSPADISWGASYGIPGIVYDYTGGVVFDAYGSSFTGITAGHSLNASSQIYTFGPNRMATPDF